MADTCTLRYPDEYVTHGETFKYMDESMVVICK